MNIDITDFSGINEPIYILEEKKLRNNLKLISNVAKDADIEIILAFKSYALWKTFPIFKEYINATTASSLSEDSDLLISSECAVIDIGGKTTDIVVTLDGGNILLS